MAEHILLTERTRFGGETGAGLMRNRCAFTPRDMAADWPEAFTFAVVLGWSDVDEDDPDGTSAMSEVAAKFGWDADLVAFLRDAHKRFKALSDHIAAPPQPADADADESGPVSGGVHDRPGLWPPLPGRELDETCAALLASIPEDDPWRTCWEFKLSHDLTEAEGSAFWHGANLAYAAFTAGRTAAQPDPGGVAEGDQR